MDKIQVMRCPQCGHFMNEQEFGFWSCKNCEGEWWPPSKDDTPEKLARAAREAYQEDVRVGFFGFGGKRSGGGRSRTGRKKKPGAASTRRYIFQ